MSEFYSSGSSSFTEQAGQNNNDTGRASCHAVSQDLKAEGRNALLGHLGPAVGANIFYLLFVLVLDLIVNAAVPSSGIAGLVLAEIFTYMIGIFSGIFEYGLDSIYMNLQYGQETHFSDIFAGFHENQNKLIQMEAILAGIRRICTLPAVIAAWALAGEKGTAALVILGVIGAVIDIYFALVYSQTLYILLDYPDMTALEVLRKSREMMHGRKAKLLYVRLSFLPLWLLSLVSLGIAGLWVFAYQQSARAAFYRRIMEKKI